MSTITKGLKFLKTRSISKVTNVQKNHQWGGFSGIVAPDPAIFDPFIFMAHHTHFFPKGSKDEGFPPHPHRGFETITYTIESGFDHGDSTGNKGTYGDGDIQWMTAGRGVLHSEMFITSPVKDIKFLGFQIWFNLPSKLKMSEPAYEMIWKNELPVAELNGDNSNVVNTSGINSESQGKVTVKIIAGRVNDLKSRIEKPTPISIFHVIMEHDSKWMHEMPSDHNCFIYIFEGEAEIGSAETKTTKVGSQKYVNFEGDGDRIEFANNGKTKLEFILLAGKPYKEPIVARGPFVMNTQQEIYQAHIDFQMGKFGYMEDM